MILLHIRSYLYTYAPLHHEHSPRQGSTLELDELTSTEWIRVFADRYLLTNVWLALLELPREHTENCVTYKYHIYNLYIYIQTYT